MTGAGFHAHDGWFFRRNTDGSVAVYTDESHTNPRTVIFTPHEWASIVAAVSAGGETIDTWRAALDLHGLPGPVTFTVNTRPCTMASPVVSYEELANLAGIDPQRRPTIVYRRAAGAKPDGTLVRGDSVHVTDRTVVDVAVTGSA